MAMVDPRQTTANGVIVAADHLLSPDVTEHTVVPDHYEHIFIVTGPAGCGKTTVAEHLAQLLNAPYIEGDDFHPLSNKDKMSRGIPLTDADRWDWLVTLREEAIKRLYKTNIVFVTCSALKRKYRDVIRVANYQHATVQVHYVFLRVEESELQDRVRNRVGHYMKADMVHSQMVTLEEPDEQHETDVIKIDTHAGKEETKQMAEARVRQKLADYEEVLVQRRAQQHMNGAI